MRYISTAIIMLAFAAPLPAMADEQSDVLQAILACRAISEDTSRLACMDAASAPLDPTPDEPLAPAPVVPTPPVPTPPVTTPPATPVPPLTPPAPVIAQADLEAERAALAKERSEIEQARAALEAQTQTQSENERLGVLARLGLARNAERKDERIAATITINRAIPNRRKLYTFYTSDGDLIRQDPNSRRMRLPDSLPATATIESRVLGSKWLTFTDKPGRSYKVKILDRR